VSLSLSGSPAYTVRLEAFEGPLDLLLHLIRREEMDVYDIPIARITQQYLEHIETLADLDLDTASEFLLMAATLMDIKSRMLLPRPVESEFIDEEAQADPRQELVRRLLEYRRYKEAAEHLADRAAVARRAHSRYGGPGGPLPPSGGGVGQGRPGPGEPAGGIAGAAESVAGAGSGEGLLASLVSALGEVVREFDQRPPGEIVRETLTVADKIAELVSALLEAKDRGLDFLAFLRRARSRRAAVVIFLALLELVRQGRVRLTQERPFGPVLVWAQTGIEHWGWPGRD
jgi:segregation and condensation protein A